MWQFFPGLVPRQISDSGLASVVSGAASRSELGKMFQS